MKQILIRILVYSHMILVTCIRKLQIQFKYKIDYKVIEKFEFTPFITQKNLIETN